MEQSSDNSMGQATILSVREAIDIRLTAQAVNSCAVLRVRTRVNAYALPARFASTTVEAAVVWGAAATHWARRTWTGLINGQSSPLKICLV